MGLRLSPYVYPQDMLADANDSPEVAEGKATRRRVLRCRIGTKRYKIMREYRRLKGGSGESGSNPGGGP